MATLIQSMQNLLAQKDSSLPGDTKRVLLKEYLQALALDYLYNHPRYRKLNFYGGTCLHDVYGLNRLSEDLDLDNGSGSVELTSLEEDLLAYFRTQIAYANVSVKTQQGEWGIRRTTLKFPILQELGLSTYANEALHLKVEISQHQQTAVIQRTSLFLFGRSFVALHFSLETMMAGKMLACLERNFQKGASGARIKGRDFYDLLWFMQQRIVPLEEKLQRDGSQPYTIKTAMSALSEKVRSISSADLAEDLLPLFEQRSFIENWLESYQENFARYSQNYL